MRYDVKPVPADTSREADDVARRSLRELGGKGRGRMVCELSDALRRVVTAGVRSRHPEYDERQLNLAVQRIWLGDDLFSRVHPDAEVDC